MASKDTGQGNSTTKLFASYCLYPLLLFGSIVAAYMSARGGANIALVTFMTLLGTGLLIMLLERVMPYSKGWHAPGRQQVLDLFHSLFSSFGMAFLLRITVLALFVYYGSQLSREFGLSLWPGHWPVVAQLLLTLVIADLGAYSAHRLMHAHRNAWRLHALHHSSNRMYFLAAGRTHPFNAVFNILLENGPILFLGISPEALLLFSVYKGVNGLLQHANIDMRPGVLNYLVATNEMHWWHHSRKMSESFHNFGNTTMLWDHVFRTFYFPAGLRPRKEVGIDNATVPDSLLVHLSLPFTLGRYEHDEVIFDGLPARGEKVEKSGKLPGLVKELQVSKPGIEL